MSNTVAPKVDKVGGEQIKKWLVKKPDLTLSELCDKYAKDLNITMGTSSMDRGLKRMIISYKKAPSILRDTVSV